MRRINMLPQGGPLPGMGQGLGRLNRQRVQQGLGRINQDGTAKMRGPQPMPAPQQVVSKQPQQLPQYQPQVAPSQSMPPLPPNPQMAGQAMGLLNRPQPGFNRPMPQPGFGTIQSQLGAQQEALQGQQMEQPQTLIGNGDPTKFANTMAQYPGGGY